MRNLQEIYNNRIMEKMCSKCDGEGVVSTLGQPIGTPSGAPIVPANPTPFQPGQAANVRKAVLTRDMLRWGQEQAPQLLTGCSQCTHTHSHPPSTSNPHEEASVFVIYQALFRGLKSNLRSITGSCGTRR